MAEGLIPKSMKGYIVDTGRQAAKYPQPIIRGVFERHIPTEAERPSLGQNADIISYGSSFRTIGINIHFVFKQNYVYNAA